MARRPSLLRRSTVTRPGGWDSRLAVAWPAFQHSYQARLAAGTLADQFNIVQVHMTNRLNVLY